MPSMLMPMMNPIFPMVNTIEHMNVMMNPVVFLNSNMSMEEYPHKKTEEKSRGTLIDYCVDITIYLMLLTTVFFREITFLNICLKLI